MLRLLVYSKVKVYAIQTKILNEWTDQLFFSCCFALFILSICKYSFLSVSFSRCIIIYKNHTTCVFEQKLHRILCVAKLWFITIDKFTNRSVHRCDLFFGFVFIPFFWCCFESLNTWVIFLCENHRIIITIYWRHNNEWKNSQHTMATINYMHKKIKVMHLKDATPFQFYSFQINSKRLNKTHVDIWNGEDVTKVKDECKVNRFISPAKCS